METLLNMESVFTNMYENLQTKFDDLKNEVHAVMDKLNTTTTTQSSTSSTSFTPDDKRQQDKEAILDSINNLDCDTLPDGSMDIILKDIRRIFYRDTALKCRDYGNINAVIKSMFSKKYKGGKSNRVRKAFLAFLSSIVNSVLPSNEMAIASLHHSSYINAEVIEGITNKVVEYLFNYSSSPNLEFGASIIFPKNEYKGIADILDNNYELFRKPVKVMEVTRNGEITFKHATIYNINIIDIIDEVHAKLRAKYIYFTRVRRVRKAKQTVNLSMKANLEEEYAKGFCKHFILYSVIYLFPYILARQWS